MATIKDVSKLAKVSPATVSRVLSGDKSISVKPETRERIYEIAQKVGYVAKRKHSSLQRKVIGLVQWISSYEEVEDPYYYSLRLSVENFFLKNRIEIRRYYKENMNDIFSDGNLSGVICMGKFSLSQANELSREFKNLIFVDSNPDKSKYNSVVSDLETATETIFNYLKSKGHHSIGFIGGQEYLGPEKVSFIDVRERSYLNLIQADPELIYNPKFKMIRNFDGLTGYDMMKKAIQDKDCPTAFICASDSIAMGALRALGENKHRTKSISVIGYNDISTSKFFNPPLTTVRIDTKLMGEMAGQLMLFKLDSETTTPVKISLHARLIERDSVTQI